MLGDTFLNPTLPNPKLLNPNDKQQFGEPIENFSLTGTAGETSSLDGALAGKKGGVVFFWSGICSHCVRYDLYLNTFADRHPDLGFLVVASRHGESLDAIKKAIKERNLKFPILLDTGGKIAAELAALQTPRAYLIDADRNLYYRGAIDNYKYSDDPEYLAYLDPAISEFLEGASVTRQETASFGCAIQSIYYILPKAL